jgi:hypothetical protein
LHAIEIVAPEKNGKIKIMRCDKEEKAMFDKMDLPELSFANFLGNESKSCMSQSVVYLESRQRISEETNGKIKYIRKKNHMKEKIGI